MAMAVTRSESAELVSDLLTTSRGVNVLQRKVKESEVGKSPGDLKGLVVIGIARKGKYIGPKEKDKTVLQRGDDLILFG